MKAIAINRPGGPEVLQMVERPDPLAGIGECLIAVEAYGINRPDVLQRKGAYPAPVGASDLPGLEVAGRIVGGDADALAAAGLGVGDAVCALVAGGGYAELCVAPIGQCLPVPTGWTMAEAASLPETCFTVWSNVFGRAALQPGESLLIHGGSSGIGVTAIQMAKALGSRVLVTVGSAAKAEACLKLGADVAINYREQDFVAEVKRSTDGRGVDVILDMVAGSYVERGVQCLADDGRMVIIAVQGGVDARFDAGAVLRRRLTVSGSTLRPRSLPFKAGVARALRERVWPLLASRVIAPVIYRELPASEAAQAHVLMESGEHIGKIVLSW
ncbi:NAD(P)H-quinone oxidoreductase [Paucibacter sp. DJ2R-2]|uniref:NAD(P)H-quinone oxidoreductase n=1 Tax=Paucibacter sp. DJ2R-2 TaxID=2893558 RepID=UPI0021E428FE|nr:NAD(P)H-quinone oxidoreductase [Paucibacter sp. DJ2R-2]MCV2420562.1 NAD(P)H-quinone oxidoreductase [Paucibacter sp. DJ4R-1]MCV2439740.1 NAD(P)H-quinone oxidoreductase [Paucibacter sp. DJ2R-2]